jgi:hypothetical protein
MFKLSLIAVSILLCGLCFGCNTYEPVRFTIRDAETGQPIPKAKIGVHYFYVLDPFHPKDANTVADDHGTATMPIATNCGRHFGASADGYIPLTSPPLYDQFDNPFQMWLYRLPQPTVEVVVPNGYRGLLTITLDPTESRIQEEPGKRHFVFHATAGVVHITTTPLLQDRSRWFFPFPVRYEDGEKIPDRDDRNVNALTTAVRFVGAGREDQLLYVIGDESDQKRIDQTLRAR